MNACELPYHQPGSNVCWDRWSDEVHAIVRVRGVVVSHNHRVVTARMEPDGRIERTSCGCVIAR